jgi:hypothetical protein
MTKQKAEVRAFFPDRGYGFLGSIAVVDNIKVLSKYYFHIVDFVDPNDAAKIQVGATVLFLPDDTNVKPGHYVVARSIEIVEKETI